MWVIPALAITGGDPDGEAHPNVGVIIVALTVEPEVEPFMICSGALIYPQVFLTAGHCTDYLDYLFSLYTAAEMKVYVSFNAEGALEEGWLLVKDVITHPDYDWGPTSNPYDVGALILEQNSDITPAQLPEEGFLDQLKANGILKQGSERAKFTVVGYGTTLEWPPPKIVAPDGMRRFAVSEYLNLRKVWLHMSQNQAPGKEDSGTCSGDSGGPVFWTEDEGPEIIVAVTSWGDAVCVATGTTYRVDISDSLSFIDDVINPIAISPAPAANRLTTTWGDVKSSLVYPGE
jgi:secreted trypsin-like serine protease